LYTKLGGIETTDKPIFRSLEPVFGKQEYPASAFYIFANVTLVDITGKILLTLSEDRAKKDIKIWTPPGGETKVRKGQMPRDAAVAEVYEEVGIELDPKRLVLIGEPQFIYPTKEYDPYKGIGLIILSYGYSDIWWKKDIQLNKVPEKGCMIVDYKATSLPSSIEEINAWDIKIYPNYAKKLLELYRMLNVRSRF